MSTQHATRGTTAVPAETVLVESVARQKWGENPMKSTIYGTMEGTKYRNAPGSVGALRGLAQEVSAPMQPKYTHPQTQTEYQIDRRTGAIRFPVQCGGAKFPANTFRDVLIDLDMLDRVTLHRWVIRSRADGVLYATARAKISGYSGLNILRLIAAGDLTSIPRSATPANGDWLDARLANINVPSQPDRPHAKSKGAGRLRGVSNIDRAQRSAIDVDVPLLPSPVKVRAQRKRRGAGVPPAVRDKILQRDGGICFYCEFEADQVDHIIPYSYGGTDDEANLIACCGICNGIATDKVFNTLAEKREYVRARYGPYMERRYRRFLQKHSVCASCQKLYNPQDALASMVLCPKCYQAELREDA